MRKAIVINIIVGFLFSTVINAQIKLPRLISDGMVLQRDKTINIWGWSSPQEEVSLSFKGKKFKTVADAGGKWMIPLTPQKAGGPHQFVLNGKNVIKVSDIYFGDVWICGGQSNMELTMERVKGRYANEIAKTDNKLIRQFTVPDRYNFIKPEDDIASGKWIVASGKEIFEFSAVAFFFAKELYTRYKIPIGLINSALGGSPAESWISEESLKKFPAYYAEAQRFKDDNLIRQIESGDKKISDEWYGFLNQKDEGHKLGWKEPAFDDADWQQMEIPDYWSNGSLGNINGSVWFRKTITLDAALNGKPAFIEMGRIVDADSVFINGKYIGNTTYQYPPRRYNIPAGVLRTGTNTIVIRVVNSSGRGGFVLDKPYFIRSEGTLIDLKGTWKYKLGARMDALPGSTVIRWKPIGLYNAMIAPLINYPIKGVIWYQGEANTKNPYEYHSLMETLINDWRTKWNQGDFPFFTVQLASFMEKTKGPQESNWAALRQQQFNTSRIVSNTGMAVTIDAGEWNDIHPENKKIVGERLSLLARQIAYKEKSIHYAKGPQYWSAKTKGNKITVEFTDYGTGLWVKGKELIGFAIAGADKKYKWAKTQLGLNSVTLWHPDIPDPRWVRYAWADNPDGANLYSKEGTPASPFSTEEK